MFFVDTIEREGLGNRRHLAGGEQAAAVDPRLTEGPARAQHASAHRLADALPDETAVLPTHGFGGFCSSAQAGAT